MPNVPNLRTITAHVPKALDYVAHKTASEADQASSEVQRVILSEQAARFTVAAGLYRDFIDTRVPVEPVHSALMDQALGIVELDLTTGKLRPGFYDGIEDREL